MSRRLFDLRLFDEQTQPQAVPTPVAVPTQATLQIAPPEVPPPTPAISPMLPPTGDTFTADGLLKHMEAQAAAKAAATQLAVPGIETPPVVAPGVVPVVPGAPVVAPVVAPAVQAQPPQVVALPPEILQGLTQMILRNTTPPAEPTPLVIPEPILPEIPKPPEWLHLDGTREDQEEAFVVQGQGKYIDALTKHNMAVAKVEAERESLIQGHKQQVRQQETQRAFTAAFTKQAVVLGGEKFPAHAEEADKILRSEIQGLLAPGVAPETAVAAAFEIAKARLTPAPETYDLSKASPQQRAALKASLREEIVKEYMVDLLKSGQTVPQVISASIAAGKTLLTAPQMPKDLDEAQKQWLASVGVPKR